MLKHLAALLLCLGLLDGAQCFPCYGASRESDGVANIWPLSSPDSLCSIEVVLEKGELTYQTRLAGMVVIRRSPLGLIRDDQSFESALAFDSASPAELRKQRYDLMSGNKTHVESVLNARSLVFANTNGSRVILDLAAGRDGVAFRCRFPDESRNEHRVLSEKTAFTIPAQATEWVQPYNAPSKYTPAYEDFYFERKPGDALPNFRSKSVGWSFPLLLRTPEANWALITETGTDGSYCACHLNWGTPDGTYRIEFPLSGEKTQGHDFPNGPEPRHSLPWTMPWRVIVMGKSAADVAMSTLITDLAQPSKVSDTSWIKPGRASWSWWSYPEGPNTVERYDKFSEFAAKMGWEYTLFDGGWWSVNLKTISDHAHKMNIAPIAWSYAGDFYGAEQRHRKLDELAAGGVQGVKADFWCSDRQESIAAMQQLFADAAERHMIVDLHGCTLPRGWQRTWPNFLTAEAVTGSESYFYERRFPALAASLNTILPFTRNVAGPMDFTPVACSPKKFERLTTAAHELAAALIFNSGIICYADNPEFFASLPPEALAVLRDAPARWEESRCLVGEPGKTAVFARRSGQNWFIAGINGTEAESGIDLDLSKFLFSRALLVEEGADPKMQVSARGVNPGEHWRHDIPPRGGFILRLSK